MTTLRRLKPTFPVVLTPDFLGGGSLPDLTQHLEDTADLFDAEAIEELFAHALALDVPSKTDQDAWIAPRFHYLFRVPRRIAADRGVWAWLAATVCRPYVFARFGSEGPVKPMRFYGDLLRNAVSRLWWGAEMVRNGPDYSLVPTVFSRVRTAEFALELRYSWYRPAAIAFTRVAEGVGGGKGLSDSEMKDLSKSINAYLSLTSLEAMGLSVDDESSLDDDWRTHRPTFAEVVAADVQNLEGPRDGSVSKESINGLEEWFTRITAELGRAA